MGKQIMGMNLPELEKSGLIFYKTMVGSQAYGTKISSSDVDVKGFYWVMPEDYLGLNPPIQPSQCQISDERNNNTFYSLYRAFELLKVANPNFIELLWMPKDCILYSDSIIMPDLLAERKLFISKQAYYSHAEYARTQIKKARGKNKMVHNPAPKERPTKEDFCRVILLKNLRGFQDFSKTFYPRNEENGWTYKGLYPFRPVPLKELCINLPFYHASSLEHVPNVYRLYYYGENAKGVFRGDDMLCNESIPKEDEWSKITGLLIYDKNEYNKAVKDWQSYWTWKNERNESRWIDQEKGALNYDQKNLCHCMRLMMESKNILTLGEPIVRFEGEDLEFLMKIRRGEFAYEELMERVDKLDAELKILFDKSDLPEESDGVKLDKLYRHLMDIG